MWYATPFPPIGSHQPSFSSKTPIVFMIPYPILEHLVDSPKAHEELHVPDYEHPQDSQYSRSISLAYTISFPFFVPSPPATSCSLPHNPSCSPLLVAALFSHRQYLLRLGSYSTIDCILNGLLKSVVITVLWCIQILLF